jgi:hypothetical protein
LGKVAVDAIEAAQGVQGKALGAEEKLRLADLARRIVNLRLGDETEAAPFNVLRLPARVSTHLGQHIAAAGFVTGVYAAAHGLLHGDEAETPSYDDIEDEGAPDPWEREGGPAPDEVPKSDVQDDGAGGATMR